MSDQVPAWRRILEQEKPDVTEEILAHIALLVESVQYSTAHLHSKTREATGDATARKHARWLARAAGATWDGWAETLLASILPGGSKRYSASRKKGGAA